MKKYLLTIGLIGGLLTQMLLAQQIYDERGESRYGYTPVRQGSYWGVVDSAERLVAPCRYKTAQVLTLDCNKTGFILNMTKTQQHDIMTWDCPSIPSYYDLRTQKVVQIPPPAPNPNVTYHSDYFKTYENFALIYSDPKVGLINRKGKYILLPTYDRVTVKSKERYICATVGEQTYYFNYKGKAISPKWLKQGR